MADLAVDDEDGGHLDEAEVVGGLLLGARQQAPEAVEPGYGPPPPPSAGAGGGRGGPAAAAARPRSPWAGCAPCSPAPPPPPGSPRSRSPGPAPGGAARSGAGSTTVASSSAANFFMSWRLAPVRTTATGMPLASVRRWRLVPGLPRSVGLRPVACASPAPPFCRRGLSRCTRRRLAIPNPARRPRRTRAAAPPRPAPAPRSPPTR